MALRCTPSRHNTARKITNATATQNSASSSCSIVRYRTRSILTLEHGIDRFSDRVLGRRNPGELGDDRSGGLRCDTLHVSHRAVLGLRNGTFGLGELAVERCFE